MLRDNKDSETDNTDNEGPAPAVPSFDALLPQDLSTYDAEDDTKDDR